MQNSNRSAYIKLIIAIIGWAGVYHSAHYLAHHSDIYGLAFIRYFLASVILVSIIWFKRGYLIKITDFKKHYKILILLGTFGIGIYNIGFFIAESHLPASKIALIIAFTPCVSSLMSSFYFRQKLGIYAYIGMIIALLGTVGVINYGNASCGRYWCNFFEHLSTGEIAALSLCITTSLFNIMSRIASQNGIDSLTITAFAAIFGDIILFFSMLLFGNIHSVIYNNSEYWILMTYTVLIGSVLCYFWYSEAIAKLGVSRISVFLNGIPFTAVLIDIIFFKHAIHLPVIISGMVIIFGVIMTNRAISR
ncbi:MAG: DMT family transporter [Burkholderiales bacterium]|nr:DMT family transporter [Burkholderiales bacterium]